MKHYLKEGDEVIVECVANVEYNGPHGFTVTREREFDAKFSYDKEKDKWHALELDDDGYFWEDE